MTEKQVREELDRYRHPDENCDCPICCDIRELLGNKPDVTAVLLQAQELQDSPFTESEGVFIANEIRVFIEDTFHVQLIDEPPGYEYTDA